MWFIISSANPDHKYVVFGGKKLSIGRKECDILVTSDATVSRKHAELSMSHTESNVVNPSKLPVLLLKDLSKFGTWVNNQRVEGERVVKDGDTVYFGSPKSTFMVVSEPLVVTTSCLDNADKKSVRQMLCTLGGHMVNEWNKNCAMLIMSKISVTIKVICAMVSLKPVVTPAYLEAYLKHLHGSREKPEPDVFTPDVAESQLDPTEVTFASDPRRKTLFQGMTFVFLSQKQTLMRQLLQELSHLGLHYLQFKKMSLAIELAGGTPLLMDKPGEVDMLTESGTVVMSCTDQEASQQEGAWISKVEKTLEKAGKHMIADAELGYAVLYASTDKHCNPDYVAETSLYKLPSQTMSQMDVFAPDTAAYGRSQAGKESQNKKSRNAEGQRSKAQGATQYTGQSELTVDNTTTVPTEKSQRSQLKQTRAPTPTVEAKVKKEVPSQIPAPQSSRKRTRIIVEQEESDEEDFNSKRIKAEPVTPVRGAVKHGNKPQQTKVKDIVEADWDSDDGLDYSKIDIDESISIRQRRTSPRHSPKPSPRTSPARSEKDDQKKKNRSRSRSPYESDKKRNTRSRSPNKSEKDKRNTKSRSKSPHESEKDKKRNTRSRSRSPHKSEKDKKRNTRSRSKSPSEPAKKTKIKTETQSFTVIDDDDDDEYGVNKSKKSRSDHFESGESRSTGTISKESKSKNSKTDEKIEDISVRDSRKSKRREVVESSDDESAQQMTVFGNERVKEENGGPSSDNHTVPAGFMTSVKTEQGPAVTVKTEVDEDLPRGCVQVEVVSLVVKRPKPIADGSGDCPEGFTRWKGRVIRNFKKFRKTEHCGANKLPKIIGGSDLEVHKGQKSKEVDDWMKESLQAESQHTREDERAQAMFDYNPTTKRRGR